LDQGDHTGAGNQSAGGRSARWNQVKAHVPGMPCLTCHRQDLAALGRPIIAGCALGNYADLADTAEKMAHKVGRYEPDPGRRATFPRCTDA
jgi:ribulose kinase